MISSDARIFLALIVQDSSERSGLGGPSLSSSVFTTPVVLVRGFLLSFLTLPGILRAPLVLTVPLFLV